MVGVSWELDADTVERYDPASQGWAKHHGPYRERFPEAWDRPMCAWREFWTRGDERLVVEWEIEGVALRAVFLNGQDVGPVTGANFDAVWMRPSHEQLAEEELWFGPADAPFRFQGERG